MAKPGINPRDTDEISAYQINIDLSQEDPTKGKGLRGAYVIFNLLAEPVMLVADMNTDPIEIYPKYYNEENEVLTPVPDEEAQKLADYLGPQEISLGHLFTEEGAANERKE